MISRSVGALLLLTVAMTGCDVADLIPPPRQPPAPPVDVQAKPRVAKVGVGKKSSSITSEGVVTTPIRALFVVEEKTVFQIQIPHTMNAFKALNGHAPKSHEEFMEKIIGNEIHLPELPEGMRYQYDPATEQLMVHSDAMPAVDDGEVGPSNTN